MDIGVGDGSGTVFCTPLTATSFWLGGMPDWMCSNGPPFGTPAVPVAPIPIDASKPIKGFRGFSANPLNPFDNSSSRTAPFCEFDPSDMIQTASGFRCWPKNAMGDRTTGAIIYFRAENKDYSIRYPSGAVWKSVVDAGDTSATPPQVFPAIDNRLSTSSPTSPNLTWMNPASFQIFSSGLNCQYATPDSYPTFYPNPPVTNSIGPYLFPSGDNYAPNTYDDITNFSGGTLEDAIP
jgi:hypothetical protein